MSNHQRGIQTVEFAGEILELVCNSPKALSLSEIAEALDLAPGSAYKYLVSLLRTGLLKRNENTLEFEAGSLSLRMGLARIKNNTLLEHVRENLTALAEKYQLNVFASMWSKSNGPTVVFYKQAGGFFHIGFRLGIRLSLNRTASGRVFAAYMEPTLIDAYAENIDKTEYDALKSPEINEKLNQIKELGYSHIVGSPTPGISSFAVPVFNASNEFMMTITAFHNSEIFTVEKEINLVRELKNIAQELKELQHG